MVFYKCNMTAYYWIFPIVILLILYLYFTRNNNYWKKKNVAFLKPLPFFGNIIDGIMMRACVGELFHKFYQQAETPVLGIFILDKPCLLIKDLRIIKRILINDFQTFCDRNTIVNAQEDPECAYMLFMLKHEEWREMRSKVTPIFSIRRIKIMTKLFEEVSDEMIGYLKEKIESNPYVDIKEVSVKFTVDVITSAVFGVAPDSFKNENSRFSIEAKRITDWNNFLTSFRVRCYFLAHTLVKLFKMKFTDPVSTKFLKESFLNILEIRARTKSDRNDLIDMVLKLDESSEFFLEKEKFVSQAIMFFVAGFETTSSAISYGLFEIAHKPEIQTQLREEVIKISEKHGGINYDSLKEMEYLDMCVNEILRKYPVFPFVERQCNTDYTIPETGTVIDKGTPIFISNLALHYDPQYFPNPDVFDPERFSQKNKHNIQKCSYLPFGEGPRSCIGARFGLLTIKFGLAHILKNFLVDCVDNSEKIEYNPYALLLSTRKGITLKLQEI